MRVEKQTKLLPIEFIDTSHNSVSHCLQKNHSQRVSHNYLDWAEYQNRHSSKSIWMTKLVFCQNDSTIGLNYLSHGPMVEKFALKKIMLSINILQPCAKNLCLDQFIECSTLEGYWVISEQLTTWRMRLTQACTMQTYHKVRQSSKKTYLEQNNNTIR